MVRDRVAELVRQAVAQAQRQGLLPEATLPEPLVERPQKPEHGDYATSLPLKLARGAGIAPYEIARRLAGLIPPAEELDKVVAAPPGFVNFVLSQAWLQRQVDAILATGQAFGSLDLGHGQRIQIEFVSVNPTGPLHVGHGRGAVLGSTLARLLPAAGYKVETEYYINDAGAQMTAFYRSLYARYLQALGQPAEMPAEGYVGAYMVDLGREMALKYPDLSGLARAPEEQVLESLGRLGVERMLGQIREDLKLIGVEFDNWFSERSLFEKGQYERAMALLRESGYLKEMEGALWFVSTALGEDKDNVVVRSTGVPTYFATDIAYHYNKFVERGYGQVINVWGADHLGHVPRMKAAVSALGIDPERLRVIVSQLVTLRRGEEVVRVSKRTGDIITLRDVVDEVGADPCRFFFLSRSADSQMDFDLELAKRQSPENPVYYVQYAHARLSGILRNAQERGMDYSAGDVALLVQPEEMALVRQMLLLPEVIELATRNLEPHHLPHYAMELATAFHTFYDRHRVITEDQPLTKARLKLVAASRVALARTLGLMGMAAPERM
ncbi:MAG: arginine--tRNA ligase [Chloroflexi bacterium]|nr:arginine--tRNA ligase [Chloroflexota bacterium]